LRGTNANLICVDEAAYIPLEMFYEVIVPLIGMEDAVLVMISTPVDSFNFFTKLMNMRDPDTGDPLFLLVDMELSCARCKKRDPLKCTHRLKLLPPWKSEDKNKIMKVIMQDQLTILVRENMGIVTDEGNSLIPSNAIDRWLDAPRFVPEKFTTAPILVLTVDPNGGGAGTGSEMAICTVAIMYGSRVVSIVFFIVYFRSPRFSGRMRGCSRQRPRRTGPRTGRRGSPGTGWAIACSGTRRRALARAP